VYTRAGGGGIAGSGGTGGCGSLAPSASRSAVISCRVRLTRIAHHRAAARATVAARVRAIAAILAPSRTTARYISTVRWLLPLIFAIALALCFVDAEPPPRKKRERGALDREPPPLDFARLARNSYRDHGVTVRYDGPAAQCGRFDATTGTLTWFDVTADAVTYN
jgi:hypothetical protein